MTMALQYAENILLLSAVTFLLLFLFKKKHIRRKQDICRLLLIAYIVGICSVTLFPAIDCGIDSATNKPYIDFLFRTKEMGGLNLIPLKTIFSEFTGNIPELGEEDRLAVGILSFAGNICLYIPLGFLLPFASESFRPFRFVMVFTLGLSCLIEIIQYFIGRSADIDDVLLQLLGAAIGYGLWRAKTKLRAS